jgi:hypothetical protein
MTRTISTSGHPACLGAKLSLAMRSPHFIREFALLLPALAHPCWPIYSCITPLIGGWTGHIAAYRLNGMPTILLFTVQG